MSTKADCYRIIQEIAVARDKVCQHPDCSRPVDCGHHLFKRDRLATAFIPDAVLGLCTQDHTGWAHNQPKAFKAFMVERLGERYHQLRRMSYEVVKNLDYTAIYQDLARVLEAYKHGA